MVRKVLVFFFGQKPKERKQGQQALAKLNCPAVCVFPVRHQTANPTSRNFLTSLHVAAFDSPFLLVTTSYRRVGAVHFRRTVLLEISEMEHMVGLLKVKVIGGINLAPRDASGSDAYVVLTMGSQKVRTDASKDSVNPQWNEDLTLCIEDPEQAIKLEVYDKDTFTPDDKMGDAEFNIKLLGEAAKMDLADIPNGTIIKNQTPSSDNCLAKESIIALKDGFVCQEIALKLRNVENGEVILQLQWVNISHTANMCFPK